MPTGSGKTIVAAELVKRHLDKHPALASLFLVPTQDLVEQQAQVVISQWCTDTRVFQFSGGLADPEKERATGRVCVVSTPKSAWISTRFTYRLVIIMAFLVCRDDK
jgi:superfamily II DNA or RNA helicase